MKKIIILLTFILHAIISLQAQTVSYEKLDSISSEISRMQSEVNGKTYNNGDSEFELSFPEENFKVFYNNQLVTTAIYIKQNGEELLMLTENIDFSKATGLTMQNSSVKNTLMQVALHFPKDYLKTQLSNKGEIIKTISTECIEFYCKASDLSLLRSTLFEIISKLRIQKGLFTYQKFIEEEKDINKLNFEEFLTKHPHSLYAMNCKMLIDAKKEQEKKVIDKSLKENPTVEIANIKITNKNLSVSHFRNGDIIPEAKTVKEWYDAGINGKPVWCNFDNNEIWGNSYGKLYNWFAVNDPRGLAPIGYHIANEKDWNDIILFLDNGTNTDPIKSTFGWSKNKLNGKNTLNFNAYPVPFRQWDGSFTSGKNLCIFWLADEDSKNSGKTYMMYLKMFIDKWNKGYGFAVRCVQD